MVDLRTKWLAALLSIGLAGTARAQGPPADAASPRIADPLAKVLADYKARLDACTRAVGGAKTDGERQRLERELSPDLVSYCRRLVDLARDEPASPAARDALIWVIDRSSPDWPESGDEFGRAASLLVRHHGDDPAAIRAGLEWVHMTSARRDAMLAGFLAAAESRESKGLARLAMARYLRSKADRVAAARARGFRRAKMSRIDTSAHYHSGPWIQVHAPVEDHAYDLQIRPLDPEAVRAEAERLFEEVAAEYDDIPYTSRHLRSLADAVNGPMPAEQAALFRKIVASNRTAGLVARDQLDEMRHVSVGKVVPDIDGVDLDGKPLRLSDHRGKVVVLVFWSAWRAYGFAEAAPGQALADRFKDRPFAIFGINCGDKQDAALKAAAAAGITWPSWHDGENGQAGIAARYHAIDGRAAFLIDADGRLRGRKSQIPGDWIDRVGTMVDGLESKPEPAGP